MLLLALGLFLWVAAHAFKRVAPDMRGRLGDPGKGLVALATVAGLILMILGYRWAEYIAVWSPPSFMIHINNLLMIIAVFVFATAHTKGRLRGWTRHPMLISVIIWAVAHLLVNGDAASLLLFGVMGLWALGSIFVINAAEPEWTRPEPGAAAKDVLLVVITVGAFVLFAGVHWLLGYWPFPQ